MRRYTVGLFALSFMIAGCAGGGGHVSGLLAPAKSPVSASSIPETLARPIPPPPPAMTPAKPSTIGRQTSAVVHPAFFAGESALSNGVYYLALPNGNPFGYYSYLPDAHYIYHFDMGYEYLIDANDGQGGLYMYDFASSHWWYTGRTYPFPYVYDFSFNSILYYSPAANSAGHYTTNPRSFYNFDFGAFITVPMPNLVRFNTTEGSMIVQLRPDKAPNTVTNFLKYVNNGLYANTLIHRSVPGFIIQGGGYYYDGTNVTGVTTYPPVANEFSLSNKRATLAMAKQANDPNSATSQFFFNESDSNATNLDTQDGGFTVFGIVMGTSSLAVMDKIANVPVPNTGSSPPFDQLPIKNYVQGQQGVSQAQLIYVNTIAPLN